MKNILVIEELYRKIRTLSLTADEFKKLSLNLDQHPQFVLWQL